MYCERCNLDFPVGLRYCKWCGQGLVERPRITSELQACPSCSAQVQPKWTFCKSCGINLASGLRQTAGIRCPLCGASSATGALNCSRCGHEFARKPEAKKGNKSARSSTALIAQCPSCGEDLDTGSKYCKSCGSAVSMPASPFGASSLLCNQCTSFSPLGSKTCRVCGAPFGEPDPARKTKSDAEAEARQSTLPDLPERLAEREQPDALISTEGMGSPAEQAGAFEMETVAFLAPAPEQSADPSDEVEADRFVPETVEMERVQISAETEVLPGVGPEAEMPPQTSNFSRRETNPVEQQETEQQETGQQEAEDQQVESDPDLSRSIQQAEPVSPSAALTIEAFQLETLSSDEATRGEATEHFGAGTDESGSLPEGTLLMGAAPGEPQQRRSPFVYETEVINLRESEAEIEADETDEEESKPDSGPMAIVSDHHFEDVQTAPFGLSPSSSEPLVAFPDQSGFFDTHSDNEAIVSNKTEVIDALEEAEVSAVSEQAPQEIPPYSALEPYVISAVAAPASKPRSIVTIASIALGVIMIGVAAYLGWWYLSGGPPQSEIKEVTQPVATIPAEAPTPPAPNAPEGMLPVAGGTYIIGRNEGDEFEKPEHTANLKAFYIDRTEVTNDSYKKFIDATGQRPPDGWKDGTYPPGQANFPVTGVSWTDAERYARWAGKRLPTEEEWEAAARGTDGRIYPWGNEWEKKLANIETDSVKEVGQYPLGASPSGALDMIGNVWEWTADKFSLYENSPVSRPDLKRGVTYRVIRGGAFDGGIQHDASYRGFVDADRGYEKTGFRCAKDGK